MNRTSSRPRRRRSLKIGRTYREPDSETEPDLESMSTRKRSARSRGQLQTYHEATTSEEELQTSSIESASDSEPDFASLPTSRNANAATKSTRARVSARRSQRNSKTQSSVIVPSQILHSFKKRKTSHHKSKQIRTQKDVSPVKAVIFVNVNAPAWQTIEYRILVKIMQYASYPLYAGASKPRPSIEWLIGVSRLCRSFHDAAMTALLWEPPLFPFHRAHSLLEALSHKPEHCMVNYQAKIRSLNIDVKILVKKSGIKFENLVKVTPLLSHLRIFHGHDEMIGKVIWAEPSISHFKWSYDDLFDQLDNNSIRLKSFEWNGRFQDTLHAMSNVYQRPCMVGLENLSIVNFNFTDKQTEECIAARDQIMSGLSSLSQIKRLEFRNCTFLDSQAMVRLPSGLQSLTIVNSLSLTSEGMGGFLSTAGHDLKELHLEGNQVMDLGFMPSLSNTCPKLETLYIDLSYEDCSSYRDRNPLYDELLPNGSPTWPTSLVSIIVGPLRSLDVTDAQSFYYSLINAASKLPYLRVLSVKTILTDASWRDRAGLRMTWRSIFEKVFTVKKTYIPTIAARLEPETKLGKSKKSQRKSARLQELEDMSISEEGEHVDETLPDGSPLPHQNRCEIVEFELSDQRPAQEQFREDDFLDSEPSGDDEWNGTDQTIPNPRYAW